MDTQPQPRRPITIREGDAPGIHTNRQGIVPPDVQNFEIKSSLIRMVQNSKFEGLLSEDPLDHLDDFDRLCGLTKLNGVSEDAMKLRLFPFSLGGKARIWEKTLLPGSITTWAECKKAFLLKFYSNSRTAQLRNEISRFAQKHGETFCEAWERFKIYISQCPHHGFSTESLLCILYRGILPNIRMLLDAASNGNFLHKDVDEGWILVDNLAQSDANSNEDYDRAVRGSSEFDDSYRTEMKALNEKIDQLLIVHQKQQPQTNTVPTASMEQMLQQLLQGQTNLGMEHAQKFAELKHQLDTNYYTLNTKIEAMNSRLLYLENKGASPSSSSTLGQLPGKAIQNPKDYAHVNAITLRSGKKLPVREESNPITEDSEVKEGEGFSKQEAQNGKSTKGIKLSESENPAAPEQKRAPYVPPPYEPKLPFPGRCKKELLQKYQALFDKQIAELEMKMPLLDACALMPQYEKFLKGAVLKRKNELQEQEQVKVLAVENQECKAIVQEEVIKDKLEDPGSFTLPCTIGTEVFENSLCDLGASVSIMPLSTAQKLGFEEFKPSNISLVLADRSIKTPHGFLKDIPIKIGKIKIPTDFVVLKMEEKPPDPLILGRPFLATAGAVIDVKEGKIILNLGNDLKMKFDMHDVVKNNTIEGHIFSFEELIKNSGELSNEPTGEDPNKSALVQDYEAESKNLKGLIGPKIEFEAAEVHSNSIEALGLLLEPDKGGSDEWLELKKMSKWQDRAIVELNKTVKELKDEIKSLQVKANHGHFSIKNVPPDIPTTP